MSGSVQVSSDPLNDLMPFNKYKVVWASTLVHEKDLKNASNLRISGWEAPKILHIIANMMPIAL